MTAQRMDTAPTDLGGQRARAALVAKWTAITGEPAPPKPTRSRRLAARLRTGDAVGAGARLTFTGLCQAPDWIGLPLDQRAALARAAILAIHADTIRKTISGERLRTVTAIFGEAMVDRVLAAQGAAAHRPPDDAPSIPFPVDRRDAEAWGFAILALAAPAALAPPIDQPIRALTMNVSRARAVLADALLLLGPPCSPGQSDQP